jgi:hypothetical protein
MQLRPNQTGDRLVVLKPQTRIGGRETLLDLRVVIVPGDESPDLAPHRIGPLQCLLQR